MLFLLTALLACTGADDDDDDDDDDDTADTGETGDTAPAGPGTLSLSFAMDDDYIAVMGENGETPVGTFYGSVYAEEDASSIGPNDGAVSLQDFSVEGMDLMPDGGPTVALHTTDPLDPQIVWILGCLDADGNGCNDEGDPITIPNENKFQVVGDTDTPVEIYMGMLRP